MVVTVLQAQVAVDQSEKLEREFKQAITKLDEGIVETFLLHSFADAMLWQIVTVWSSREALEKMRSSGETPRGVLIFRAAGAEPTLSVLKVSAQANAS